MSQDLRKVIAKNKMPPTMPHKGPSGSHQRPTRDFTPLDWRSYFDDKKLLQIGEDQFNVYLKGNSGPVFYFLHGGGYSGLTWACLANSLSRQIECRILAPDLRGHGDTKCLDEDDLSTERQISDIGAIFDHLYGEESPPVCIVGHSMGGALAVHAVEHEALRRAVGLIVVDVVEGSAMDALAGMVHFLRGRPEMFESYESAIKWCLQSGTARNHEAARISMPSQIKQREDGKYTWRIDLSRTQCHWVGWFKGLSESFLKAPPPKVLVLAGVDRLDKTLMIGQMQGKFQTFLLQKVGHAVQEDSPEELATELARFAIRFKFAQSLDGTGHLGQTSFFPSRDMLPGLVE